MRTFSIATAFFLWVGASVTFGDTVQLTWGYNSPASILKIFAADGTTPLAGAATNGTTGTGFAVELGYYSQATASNPFAGTWTPVFGKGDANALFSSASLGDGRTTADLTDIRFGETAIVDTTLPNTAKNLPVAGQIMAIRYYNAAQSGAALYYGVASNSKWKWIAPAAVPPIPASYNISQSGTVFQSATVAQTNQRTFTGLPHIGSQPADTTTGGAGSTIGLSVAATGPGLVYQWYLNGTAISGATQANYHLTLENENTGSYSVTISDAYGDTVTGGPYALSLTTSSLAATDTPSMPLFAQLLMALALLVMAWRYIPLNELKVNARSFYE